MNTTSSFPKERRGRAGKARRSRCSLLSSGLAVVALLAGPLAIDIGTHGAIGFICSANAAPGGNPGGNGGGPPDEPGAPPVDFGDLIILLRYANGVPILTPDRCWQPLPSAETCPEECQTQAVDENGNFVYENGDPVWVVKVDPATCGVLESVNETSCQGCTQEVDFGRISEARSSDAVFESQLEDVIVNLATSDCEVTLDPAGRMVTSTGAVDSPLQNLAIYRQLIRTGSIGVPLPQGATVLDTAARALGAASDKAGEVNVDLVAYLNQIMGLSDPATPTILDPKICIDVKEEVQGAVQLVQKCFLDYSAYGYNRGTNFGMLPAPAYIPETPVNGWFEYLMELNPNVPTFTIAQGPILDAVFPDSPFVQFDGGNIGGFAQAADDAREVIDFMHTWPVPGDYATAVPCAGVTGFTYDISISDVSGLQVPRNIVSGTEGREFTVSVANGGPDPAASVTVTVTATIASGGVVPGSPWEFTFYLPAGQSVSFTEQFSVTVGEATTIDWTATVEAEFDVNPANNEVKATSNVRVTGGGR